MVQIKWTKLAVNDLKGIYAYISLDSEKYAKIQVLRIRNRTRILSKHPLSGKPVKEYKSSTNRVDILTIHQSARILTRRQIE
ncbi:MAG: type II toxin-antitoxin system RelE/ParE family toxin [Cyclobacteriaceae bacterium]|jgi:plasmid stabilization system protein ParE